VRGGEWERLDATRIPGATYSDAQVSAGTTYEYAATAFDRATPPNESGKSPPVVATIP
jgi:hypothetical protein